MFNNKQKEDLKLKIAAAIEVQVNQSNVYLSMNCPTGSVDIINQYGHTTYYGVPKGADGWPPGLLEYLQKFSKDLVSRTVSAAFHTLIEDIYTQEHFEKDLGL